jgi:hypothetical protein
MNPARIWTIGAAVAVIAVLGIAFGLGVQPQLAAASVAKAATAQTEAQIDTTQAELAGLSRAAAKQADLQADADDLRWAIPRTLQLSTFSQQLRNVAALDGVKITGITTAPAVPYVSGVSAAVPAATAVAGAQPTPAPTATPAAATAEASAEAAAGTSADPGWFGKTNPLVSKANFLVIPVTIIVSGDEAGGLAFAEDAQRMRRLFVADTVTFEQSAGGDTPSTTTIAGNMYALKR